MLLTTAQSDVEMTECNEENKDQNIFVKILSKI